MKLVQDQPVRGPMEAGKAGVYVVETTSDAEFDDFDEPVVVFKTGQLPKGMGDE